MSLSSFSRPALTLAAERRLDVRKLPLSASHEGWIFLVFGPSVGAQKSKTVRLDTLTVEVIGTSAEGQPIRLSVPLNPGFDDMVGQYYYGRFRPLDFIDEKSYTLNMQIQAFDSCPNLNSQLDSNPQTIAEINIDDDQYPISGYEPGKDLNHSFEISPSIHADGLNNNSFGQAYPLYLGDLGADSQKITGTLLSGDEEDFFRLAWQSELGDSRYITQTLQLWLAEEAFSEVAVSIYNENRELLHALSFGGNAPQGNFFRINDFKNSVGIVSLKNPNGRCQGDLRYVLSANLGIIISPPPPLMDRYWRWRLPQDYRRSFIGDGVIRYEDAHLFIQDVIRFLPAMLRAIRRGYKDDQVMTIDVLHEIAGIVTTKSLYRNAKELVVASAKFFEEVGYKQKAVAVLRNLRELYMRDASDAEDIASKLTELGEN